MRSCKLCTAKSLVVAALVTFAYGAARGDRFSYRDEHRKQVQFEGRVIGAASDGGLVELADGQYRLVPDAALRSRARTDGPEPMSADEIAEELEKQFGPEHFRSAVQPPFVVGLVLSAPLPRNAEARASNVLQQSGQFMKNVETAFSRFIKEARIPAKPPRFPLVVLIFESRTDFEKYLAPSLVGGDLSTHHVGGFYSKLTNFLALRLDECRTYEVLLHEAIHQQSYNRNLFQRLAPIPAWFDEGIATGFEANQGKISLGPGKISLRYAEQAIRGGKLSWKEMLADDRVFSKSDIVSEAYGNAWGLHWLLFTRHKLKYAEYLRRLAAKRPLTPTTSEERWEDFRGAVGKELDELQEEFLPLLRAGLKRQKVSRPPEPPAGYATRVDNQGEVKLYVVEHHERSGRTGTIDAHGSLNNLSPLRSLTFKVTMEHSSGVKAGWVIANLGVLQSVSLPSRVVLAHPPGEAAKRSSTPHTFRIEIESAPPNSRQAHRWQQVSEVGG
jgi:hypothetical protein